MGNSDATNERLMEKLGLQNELCSAVTVTVEGTGRCNGVKAAGDVVSSMSKHLARLFQFAYIKGTSFCRHDFHLIATRHTANVSYPRETDPNSHHIVAKMEGAPAQAVAMPASAPAPITATPQFQQMFASLVQMYDGSNATSNVDQRLLQLEASRDSLAVELQKTRASLTSMQEILASTQKDLFTCRSLLREHTTLINGVNHFTAKLKQESAQLLNHANTNWNKVHQVEAGFYQAHQKLTEHVNSIAGQQNAKIDDFQSKIVGPFFSAMQQVIVKDTSSSRSKSPQAVDSNLAAEAKAHESVYQQTRPRDANCQERASASCSTAVDANRSTSFDSNTPLAVVCSDGSSTDAALCEAPQLSQRRESIPRMDPTVTSSGPPSNFQSRPANPSRDPQLLDQTSPPSGTIDGPAAPGVLVGAGLPENADSRSDPTSPYVRTRSRPSPSPSQSASTQNASAHTTPQTSRASSLSLSLPADPNSTSAKAVTGTANTSSTMKRKRSSSVECVGVKLAKGAADEIRSTSGGKGDAKQKDVAQRGRPKPDQLHSTSPPSASSRQPRVNDGFRNRAPSATSPSDFLSYAFGPTHIFGRPSMIPPKAASSSNHPPGSPMEPTSQHSAAQQASVGMPSSRSPLSPVLLSHTSQSGHKEVAGTAETMCAARGPPLQRANLQDDLTSLSIRAEAACTNQTEAVAVTVLRADHAGKASGSRPCQGPKVQSNEAAATSQPARAKTEGRLLGAEPHVQASSALPAMVNMTVTSSTQVSAQEVGSQGTRGGTPSRGTDDEAARVAPLIRSNESQPSDSNRCPMAEPTSVSNFLAASPSTSQPPSRSSAARIPSVAPSAVNQMKIRVKGRASDEQARSEACVRQSHLSYLPPRPGSWTPAEALHQFEPAPEYEGDFQPMRRTATAEQECEQSLIRRLDNLRTQSHVPNREIPFYIWACLGHVGAWSGNSLDTTPVVIDPDPVVTESLIAESLAEDLIRQGRARKISAQGSTGILELELAWRFDTGQHFRLPGDSDRFESGPCEFVIVPTRYMKDGIYLGKKKLDRLGLVLVPKNRSPIPRPYLGVHGRVELGTCLCAMPAPLRRLPLFKPFERLCKLAEYAITRTEDPRYSRRRYADDERWRAENWQHSWRPATSPLADRLGGATDDITRNTLDSSPLESRIQPPISSDDTSRGMSSHLAAREAGSTRITSPAKVIGADPGLSSTVPYTRLQERIDINTDPIPDDPRSVTNASRVVCPLDSGSPLSELDDSEEAVIKVEDVEELLDD
ncbi:hypothetical protein PHSY_000037 [Pseudozyma hubeiensis SY62]|uniref:Uncharacterized protein n=1 Tax=Pseudozyma hubeiensis (strain SY62) TaxID=1305764 RepID=R9NVK8_PSEHS|nr:hypothetical protein PHSY_000037 [Pseudozyma hubeiensis SY62]GAC92484.1 hypothetical protein PHSY_000037 [Pseudozyma hubeiensis SY62]